MENPFKEIEANISLLFQLPVLHISIIIVQMVIHVEVSSTLPVLERLCNCCLE